MSSRGLVVAAVASPVGLEAFLAPPGAHVRRRGGHPNVSVGVPADRVRLEGAARLTQPGQAVRGTVGRLA